jgi:hypothetical protein
MSEGDERQESEENKDLTSEGDARSLGADFLEYLWKEHLRGELLMGNWPPKTTRRQFFSELKNSLLSGEGLVYSLDHTSELLRLARYYLRSDNLDLAALFYATYFEHCLNYMIGKLAQKRKFSRASTVQMMRDVQIRGKCSWLLEVLGIRYISAHHARNIVQISEIRNSFVHYKWQGSNLLDEKANIQKKELLKKADKVVRYLDDFVDDVLYGKKKRVVKKLSRGITVQDVP